MQCRWRFSVGRLLGVALLSASAPCRAEGPSVELSCAELSGESAAEVEARIRATLLTEPAANAGVAIHCELGIGTVIAFAGNLRESTTVPVATEHFEDALLLAVERTLATLRRRREGGDASFPEDPGPPPVPTQSVSPVPPAPPRSARPIRPSAPPPPVPVALRVGATGVVELWVDEVAYGGRLLFEASKSPWALGFGAGLVTGPERAHLVVPTEWHAHAFAAWDAVALGEVRATVAAGASVLVATPKPGLVARTGRSLPSAFAELGASRPVRWGRFAVVPGLSLRIFTRPRRVLVDGIERLELPVLVPSALLGATVDL
jgi:hypothetical protein